MHASPVYHSRIHQSPVYRSLPGISGGEVSTGALKFDGVNDYVSLGNPSVLDVVSSGSVSAWFMSSNTNHAIIFNKGNYNTNRNGYILVTTSVVTLYLNSASAFQAISAPSAYTLNVWHHAVATWDGTTVNLYVDGLLVKSVSQTVVPNPSPTTASIGGETNWGGAYRNGKIDDIRIYNVALTAGQVADLYANTTPAPTAGLVGHWKLDDGSGLTAVDSSGYGNAGTLTNFSGTYWEVQVPPRLSRNRLTEDWSVAFDGSNDYIASASSPLSPAAGNFSASAWVKFTGVSTQQVILSQLDGTGTGRTWLELTSGAKLQSAIGNSNLTGATSLVAGVWNHVAITMSGTTETLYLNGIADATGTRTPEAASGVARLGTSKSGANYLAGNIKDLRIYPSALAQSDITKLCNGQESSAVPMARWRLNDGSGTVADDAIGSNDGTLTNGPTWSSQVPPWFVA